MKPRTAFSLGIWLLALANLYYFRIADPDLWWVLRCGEDILRSGHIHQVDTYSFTAAGLPCLNHEWLTQVLFAFLFHHGGPAALVALKMAVGAAFLAVFYQMVRLQTSDARIILPALLVAAHAIGRFLLFRPQIFTFLFFTAALWILELNRRRPTRAIWVLPLLSLLWANMHGAFAVGIALIGYYWLVIPWISPGADRKLSLRLGCAFLLSCTATLVNPYGFSIWQVAVESMRHPLNSAYVEEWRPLMASPLTWNTVLFFAILAATAASGLASRARDGADWILWCVFAVLGLSAPRHIPLFAIVSIPIACRWLSAWVGRQAEGRFLHLILASMLGIILAPVLITSYFCVQDLRPRIRVLDAHYLGFPWQAMQYLRLQPEGGHIWNELAWGGCLIWELSPQWKVSLDGRNTTVYPMQVLKDHVQLFRQDPPDATILDRYPVDVCLIRRDRPLAKVLAASTGWEKLYEDDVAVIFRNRHSPWTNWISQTEARLSPRPSELFLTEEKR